MKVLSFRATAIDYYRGAQQDNALVKKKISLGKWVRGHVARIDQLQGPIYIVYMTVEEFEGGFDGQRLPTGFYYGELPAVTIGDPSNQRFEFVVSDDATRYYPVGRSIRLDAKELTHVDAINGVIVKTSREPGSRPYWRITVEYPAPALAFEHYAIRAGDTVHLNYETRDDGTFGSHDTYVKPSLKSVRFRVPERYQAGFKALYMRSKKVCVRIEDNSLDVSGYVNWINDGQAEVQVMTVDQTRRDYHAESMAKSELVMMSKTLGVPYDILVANPPYGKSPVADAYATVHELDDYMARTLAMKKEFVTPNVGYANGILRRGEMSFAFNKETDDMKIYDAVVVKTDEKGEVTEILKVVPPFLAKGDRAAQDAVTVDYAIESGIAGKDLTGIKVLVRTFQSVV